MNCMRCGKETEGKDVFCPTCLEDMAQHPVKPGTAIHIPVRQEAPIKKPAKKIKELTPEEQLDNAQNAMQILLITVLGLLTTLIIIASVFFYVISLPEAQPEQTQAPMGRNYTITTPAEGD